MALQWPEQTERALIKKKRKNVFIPTDKSNRNRVKSKNILLRKKTESNHFKKFSFESKQNEFLVEGPFESDRN